jgi:hypothetical protein
MVFRKCNILRCVKAALRRNVHSPSFSKRWAILLAVSVPKIAARWTQRFVFVLHVCYSFATVTVFQAFFASYLVEPGYVKAITTVDEEALDKHLLYGNNPYLEHYLIVAE